MPCQHCCFLQARRRCFSPQDRACQSTLLWIVRMASVLKAVFALAVNHTISVGRHRLITLRSHLHAKHWNPGQRPGFYKISRLASLLSLCIQLVGLLSQLLALFESLQVLKLHAESWLEHVSAKYDCECASVHQECCRSWQSLRPQSYGLFQTSADLTSKTSPMKPSPLFISPSPMEGNTHLTTVKLRLCTFWTGFSSDSYQFYCRITLLILVEVLLIYTRLNKRRALVTPVR